MHTTACGLGFISVMPGLNGLTSAWINGRAAAVDSEEDWAGCKKELVGEFMIAPTCGES